MLASYDVAALCPMTQPIPLRPDNLRSFTGMGMTENSKVVLKVVAQPRVGRVVDAPPILEATDHGIEHVCGNCGIVLMRAELNQVHNILIRCSECGSYNSTEG